MAKLKEFYFTKYDARRPESPVPHCKTTDFAWQTLATATVIPGFWYIWWRWTFSLNWDFAALLKDGVLFGSRLAEGSNVVELIQEGRLGYEEYAARAIGLLGLDAMVAAKYDDFLHFETIGGQSIAIDSRSFTDFDAHNFVVSEPYILTAIEFGLDTEARELAQRVFLAQFHQYNDTGQLTAVSEDNIDQEPDFVYNSVFADGVTWNALAEDGSTQNEKRTVSTKAAFGWDALFATDYTDRLMRHVAITATGAGF